jgi:hypothetical protein
MDQGSCEAPNRSEMGGEQRCIRSPCSNLLMGGASSRSPGESAGRMKLSGSVGVGEVTQSGSGKGGGEARVLGACRPPCANSEQRAASA